MGLPGSGWTRLLVFTVFLAALALSMMVFQVVQGLALLRIEGKVVPSVVPAVWDRLLRLPTRFFGEFSSGDLALRAMGLGLIFKKISGAAVTTLVTGLISLFNLGLLFWYSWRLALLSVLLLGIMLLVIVDVPGPFRFVRRRSIQKVEGTIIGFLLEVVGGNHQAADRRGGESGLRPLGQPLLGSARALDQGPPVDEPAAPVPRGLPDLDRDRHLPGHDPSGPESPEHGQLPGLDHRRGQRDDFGSGREPTRCWVCSICRRSMTGSGRSSRRRPEFPAAVLEPVRLGGALALSGVSFRYPGQDGGAKVLDDVSLQVRPGEFVAIVGASGSGKSTSDAALARVRDPGLRHGDL